MNLNKLTTNLLNIGQKILIPYDIQQEYVVKKGDTLYSIANQFSTTIDNLLNINNLQTNILSIGQILKVI
jgi:LysM repeat protein